MEELKKKIESLKEQREQARTLHDKCAGAIEVLELLLNEEKILRKKKKILKNSFLK